MGDTTTHFVSITSYLDDKLDLNSISDIILPEIYVPSQISRGTLNHHYVTNAGAIYDIDFANRTITFELNDLVLRTVQDETCKNLALTRSEIKFSVRMKPNYIFGDPVAAHSSIVFDANEPIITDSVFTICDDPLPMNNGGGFYNQDPTTSVSVIDNIWIYLLIGLGVLLVIILGVRRFKKN